MTPRPSASAALAILACAAIGSSARADSAHRDEPPATRISAIGSGGTAFGFHSSADGRPLDESAGDNSNVLVGLAVERSALRWLALGVEARVGGWDSAWSMAAGYDAQHLRVFFDLDAELAIRSPIIWVLPWPIVVSVSPSVGFTIPVAPARDTRAVRETWQPHPGGNVGIDLNVETWYKLRRSRWQLGGVAGVAYTRH
jgi:hypothetical protein